MLELPDKADILFSFHGGKNHTDRTGPDDFNWLLSQQRAEAVLAAEGIDTSEFRPVSMGPLQTPREGVDPQQLA